MYQNTSTLDKPEGDEKISRRTLGYACESAREELYQLVLHNCKESGVTKATLARRLDKDPAQISRMLGAPGNWTIDTVAELLFAIDGSLLNASSICAAEEPIANRRHATCFSDKEADFEFVVVAPKNNTKRHIPNKVAAVRW